MTVTTSEIARLANDLDAQNLPMAVAALDAELVPVYLARILDAETNLRALKKALEQRLVLDGRTGADFEVDGARYGFFGAQQKGWKDIPNLVANLRLYGVSLEDIAGSVSELRVTDLRVAAGLIKDDEKRKAALAAIEDARYDKGDRGAPRFQEKDRYVSVKKETP